MSRGICEQVHHRVILPIWRLQISYSFLRARQNAAFEIFDCLDTPCIHLVRGNLSDGDEQFLTGREFEIGQRIAIDDFLCGDMKAVGECVQRVSAFNQIQI